MKERDDVIEEGTIADQGPAPGARDEENDRAEQDDREEEVK